MVWGVMVSPSLIVFAGVSVLGVVLVIMSSGLLGMWLCLELGFFGFIPILNGKSVGENESASKYFVVQSVGSGVLLVGLILVSGEFFLVGGGMMWQHMTNLMMVVGLMIKLGVFPMHFWFPSVMGSASWLSCFWLSVVQKVGPFWVLGGLGFSGWVLGSLGFMLVCTSLVGAFGGLAQVQFRPLLAYSSLGQTGWMGLVSILSSELFLYYMILYSGLLVGLLYGLNAINSYSFFSVPGWNLGKGLFFWIFGCSFFISLSGLPPLAGSALKLVGVLTIVDKYYFYVVVLIGSSMISLYYYLSVFISGVVCIGGNSFSFYDSLAGGSGLGLIIIMLVGLNWVGGFPLFMICGGLVL
uniref:NADH-ubiquinone oxidoreductase chain 2 n=1 Tax=Solecurtus divaricatus TaxID=444102 RepID=I6NHV8_9BIVA|nr:NADH dehydrogenase subunit 2 [Solecurtus divaricatus]AEV94338.1 NADH dehydrogenase subunit 2 [Solecurtus divaricatus]